MSLCVVGVCPSSVTVIMYDELASPWLCQFFSFDTVSFFSQSSDPGGAAALPAFKFWSEIGRSHAGVIIFYKAAVSIFINSFHIVNSTITISKSIYYLL